MAVPLRRYYLTATNTHTGSQALTACAVGYHMASLWEIHDITGLRYETSLGFTELDSGSGPPTSQQGWVRTGGTPRNLSGIQGENNCLAWESNEQAGTVVSLTMSWNAPTVIGTPWTTTEILCSDDTRVWCVED